MGGVRAEINYLVSRPADQLPGLVAGSSRWRSTRRPTWTTRPVAALMWELAHVTDDEGLPLLVPHNAFAELRWGARWFLRHLWDHPLYGRQVIAAHGLLPDPVGHHPGALRRGGEPRCWASSR